MNKTWRIVAFGLVSAIWGTAWIASSEVQGHCPPLRAAAIRYGAASLLLLCISAARRATLPDRRQIRAMLILGCTMIAVPFLLLNGIRDANSSGVTAVLFALAPAALALTSRAGEGTQASRRTFHATLAGFAAMVIAMSGALAFSISRDLMLAIFVVTSVTGSLAFAKRELGPVNLCLSAGVQLAVAAILLTGASASIERGLPSQWTPRSLVSLSLLSVLGSAAALTLFYWLLKQAEPYQVAATQWMQPLIGATAGSLILHQRPPLTFWIGAAGVLVCVSVLFSDSGGEYNGLSLPAAGNENLR